MLMSACDEYRVRVLHYLDNCLQGEELADFRAHLQGCATCRASLEAEQSLSRLLHRSRPLYSAPATLRAHLTATLEEYPAYTSGNLWERISQILGNRWAGPQRRLARLRLLAASLGVAAVLLAFVPGFLRKVRAANYVETAVLMHRSYLDGSLPLELRSSSPEQVTAWFGGKVPFPFRLPRAEARDNLPVYQVSGASLVKYRGQPAALVTYQKQNEKISLLVASSDSAVVSGGEEVRSGKLTFHYRTDEGFNVVTWTTHGLSYALVSSVAGPARDSCMVCHQSMAEHGHLNPPRHLPPPQRL
jgi:mycothiol system anti-sigma-R factor